MAKHAIARNRDRKEFLPMSLSREKVAQFSKMTLDDLYEMVGREAYLSGKGSEVLDFSIKERYGEERIRNVLRDYAPSIKVKVARQSLIRSAKQLLSRLRGDLRKKICKDWNYCERRGRYSDKIELSRAIVGVVGTAVPGLPLTASYGVAFILIKKGLDKFCGCTKATRRPRKKIKRD